MCIGLTFNHMVKYSKALLDDTFAALADPTRRAILKRLARGAASMGDLAEPFGMSWPAITKHVKVLERARLVRREQDGRFHRMHLEAKPLRDARAWIDKYEKFWHARFDALEKVLNEKASDGSDMGGE
jgi:DNA-binding transcriptional ArsR family regulator